MSRKAMVHRDTDMRESSGAAERPAGWHPDPYGRGEWAPFAQPKPTSLG